MAGPNPIPQSRLPPIPNVYWFRYQIHGKVAVDEDGVAKILKNDITQQSVDGTLALDVANELARYGHFDEEAEGCKCYLIYKSRAHWQTRPPMNLQNTSRETTLFFRGCSC